ncbi:hypothetical protein K525DRAFT_265896 [Schizophyllum commune Loenen D]|nr:hypothetical protein K525DRAFT_265896 [Schizophyllum commune Loenen D]
MRSRANSDVPEYYSYDENPRAAIIGTPASFLIACGCELEVLDFELVMGLGGCTHLCSWPNSDRHKYYLYDGSARSGNARFGIRL